MATIEERLKAIEEKLGIEQKPVAGWRKHKESSKHLAYFDGKCFVYGFDLFGEWFDNVHLDDLAENNRDLIIYNSDPADPKEVEERLIEEAKRRGFKEGVKFVNLFNGEKFKSKRGIFKLLDSGELTLDYNTIFNNSSKWAEIIEEPLTLNGKEVEIDKENDSVYIFEGCYCIDDSLRFIDILVGYDIDEIKKNGVTYKVSELSDIAIKIKKTQTT